MAVRSKPKTVGAIARGPIRVKPKFFVNAYERGVEQSGLPVQKGAKPILQCERRSL